MHHGDHGQALQVDRTDREGGPPRAAVSGDPEEREPEGGLAGAGRVRIVYYSDAPYYGGAEYYLYVLATGLPRDRFEVRVILRPLASLEKLRRPLLEAAVPVFEPPEPNVLWPAHWISVYRYLRDIGADILHVNLPSPYDGQQGSIVAAGRMAGLRVVTTEHLPMVRGGFRQRLAKALTRAFVDRVITVSDTNLEWLDRLHGVRGPKVVRIYNGVDVSAFRPGSDGPAARRMLGLEPNEKAVGIIGRLDPQKDHELFLEAAAIVHGEVPDARFLVLGEGRLREQIERRAADLGLGGAVRFLGYRSDVAALLPGIDVVVFTSKQEGMPFALLEALAMERAVVATEVHGLSEILVDGRTGRLVPAGNAGAVAGAVVDLLRSPETAEALGRAGRRRVESEFERAGMIRRTADLYETLVA